ncbi:MAG TPA: RNA polymerase sigma factor [Gammaproteobacteria bacterium]
MNLLQVQQNQPARPEKAEAFANGPVATLREDLERRLIARVTQGDTQALERLYAEYRPRIHRFLARLGCPEEDFDEVCNEVFFLVWRKASTYNRSAKVSTWVLGIARNKGLKLRERKWRATERSTDIALERLAEPALGDAARLELRQWLEIALAMLPDDQRMVLELTFIEGLSYREIAELMDCPVNTVKTRMFNARRKLKAFLPADGGNAKAARTR